MKTVINRFTTALSFCAAALSAVLFFVDITFSLPNVAVTFRWPFAVPFKLSFFSVFHIVLTLAPLLFIVLMFATKKVLYPCICSVGLCAVGWITRLAYDLIFGGSWKVELVFTVLTVAMSTIIIVLHDHYDKLLTCLLAAAMSAVCCCFLIYCLFFHWLGSVLVYIICSHFLLFVAVTLLFVSASSKYEFNPENNLVEVINLPEPQGELPPENTTPLYEILAKLTAAFESGAITEQEYEEAKKAAIWQEQ